MTSRASMVNRLDNLASIIKAKKEQERAEYDALPEVVIDCAVHGEQHVKLMPGRRPTGLSVLSASRSAGVVRMSSITSETTHSSSLIFSVTSSLPIARSRRSRASE